MSTKVKHKLSVNYYRGIWYKMQINNLWTIQLIWKLIKNKSNTAAPNLLFFII